MKTQYINLDKHATVSARFSRVALVLGLGLLSAYLTLCFLDNRAIALASSSATIRYVDTAGVCNGLPNCYTSPQDAVNGANDGDIIKVANNSFTQLNTLGGHTQVLYIDKSLTLIGGYPVDFNDEYALMLSDIVPTSPGRGIYILPGITVTLKNFIIIAEYDAGKGAAIYMPGGAQSRVTLENVYIFRNRGRSCSGIYLSDGYVDISYSNFLENFSSDEGGPICLFNVQGKLDHNNIRDNTSTRGSGLLLSDTKLDIFNNMIRHNYAITEASAILAYNSQDKFTNNVIIENDCLGPGAVVINDGFPSFTHNTLTYNWSGGTAVIMDDLGGLPMTATLRNNIISISSVGLDVRGNTRVVLDGIFWDDVMRPISSTAPSVVTITHEYTGTGIFSPLNWFYITHDSPIEGKAIPTDVHIDYQGQFRPLGTGPDLGAIEAEVFIPVDYYTNSAITIFDPSGLTTTFTISSETFAQPADLLYSPLAELIEPYSQAFDYAGKAFDLELYCNQQTLYLPLVVKSASLSSFALQSQAATIPNKPAPHLVFNGGCSTLFAKPLSISMAYTDTGMTEDEENNLRLFYLDNDTWVDAATSCTPTSIYARGTAANILEVQICHLSRFAVGRGRGR